MVIYDMMETSFARNKPFCMGGVAVYHNLFDSHMHTDNSPDATHSVMYMAETAERGGLMGIAITDHAECMHWEKRHYHTRVVQSIVDTNKARQAFRYRMSISLGIEIGFTRDLELGKKVSELYPFDYVLGSLHQSADRREYYDIDYHLLSDSELKKLIDGYFEDMLYIVRWGGFDSLAHMSFPLRHAKRRGVEVDMRNWREQVEEILTLLVQKDIALELNGSPLRTGADAMPPRWVLESYRDKGGELVTIGSDAHCAEHVGKGIQECMELLEQVGYRHFAFYSKRRPIMLRIV